MYSESLQFDATYRNGYVFLMNWPSYLLSLVTVLVLTSNCLGLIQPFKRVSDESRAPVCSLLSYTEPSTVSVTSAGSGERLGPLSSTRLWLHSLCPDVAAESEAACTLWDCIPGKSIRFSLPALSCCRDHC